MAYGFTEYLPLQDACPTQVIEPLEDSAVLALQDALARQGPVLLGLIAHLIVSFFLDSRTRCVNPELVPR